MSSKQLKEICTISTAGQNLLKAAMEKLNLSARAYDRILKVARTIADIEGANFVGLDTILLKRGMLPKLPKEDFRKPNYSIKNLNELKKIFKKHNIVS